MSRSNSLVAASLTAENTFTDWIYPEASGKGVARVWISGLADSAVTIQTTYDAGTNIADVVQYTVTDSVNGAVQKEIFDCTKEHGYRIGIKAGDYGADTVVCRINF